MKTLHVKVLSDLFRLNFITDPGFCQTSNVEPQNKNNNAYTAAVSHRKIHANAEQINKPENKSAGVIIEGKIPETTFKGTRTAETKIVKEEKRTLAVKSNADVQRNGKTRELDLDLLNSKAESLHKPDISPVNQRPLPAANKEIQRASRNGSSFNSSHGKITHSVPSRFGVKTFTVVPPKPCTIQAAATQPAPAASGSSGAIRIDDQGNMVTAGITHNKVGRSSEPGVNEGAPLCEKAKAFWSSSARQENAATLRTTLMEKTKDVHGLSSPPTVRSEVKSGSNSAENQKTKQGTVSGPDHPKVEGKEETKEPIKNVTLSNKNGVQVESKSPASSSTQSLSKPALPPPLHSDLKQQPNFLKPSRRTSSKYVASAISKYTPNTSAKPTIVPKIPESSETAAGVQGSGPPVQGSPLSTSQPSSSNNKENASIPALALPGPKRSTSYPEYVSSSQRDSGDRKSDKEGFSNHAIVTKEGYDDTETIQNNNTQKRVTDNPINKYILPDQTRTPSPSRSTVLYSSIKPLVDPKKTSQEHKVVSKT